MKSLDVIATPSLGKVLEVRADGRARISGLREGREAAVCDVLQTSNDASLALAPGDAVLAVKPAGSETWVVLGRIGSRSPSAARGVPDELVLEAKNGLTLRVGDGSITLRADGKILIKGKDLVSHAKRMNRIKGGAVSIN